MRNAIGSFLLVNVVVSTTAAAQGQVHVVGGVNSEFPSITAAQNAAAPGDVVLVNAGTYGDALRLQGNVVGEFGAQVRVDALSDSDLDPKQSCLFQGLEFLSIGSAVSVSGARGPVWFERCRFAPMKPDQFVAGFRASDCDAIALNQCAGFTEPFIARALEVVDSRVHVHASAFHGNTPFDDPPWSTARARGGSFLELFGTEVFGEDGADGTSSSCNGQDGTDAVHVRDTSRLVTLGSAIVPGVGGAPFGACSPGADGNAVVLDAGASATPLAGIARPLSMNSPVREGELLQVLIGGKPGDAVWFRYASAPGLGLGFPALDGEFLLGPSSLALVGTIPPSGVLDLTIFAPDLPSGWESTIFYCQAVLRDVDTHRFVVSAPSALVLLDGSL